MIFMRAPCRRLRPTWPMGRVPRLVQLDRRQLRGYGELAELLADVVGRPGGAVSAADDQVVIGPGRTGLHARGQATAAICAATRCLSSATVAMTCRRPAATTTTVADGVSRQGDRAAIS